MIKQRNIDGLTKRELGSEICFVCDKLPQMLSHKQDFELLKVYLDKLLTEWYTRLYKGEDDEKV